MLSTKRDRKAAKRFFKKALGSNHNQMPRIITVDKNASYPIAIDELNRRVKYLNNIVEQDHRSVIYYPYIYMLILNFLQRNPKNKYRILDILLSMKKYFQKLK